MAAASIPESWQWIYDRNDMTPKGTFEALGSALKVYKDEPILVYFEAADPDYPKDEQGWCMDCQVNTKFLRDFVSSAKYITGPVRMFRAIASMIRSDWKDSSGLPNLGNPLRDPKYPWRLANLPEAVLVTYRNIQGLSILDRVGNPDAAGLEYLRVRAVTANEDLYEKAHC